MAFVLSKVKGKKKGKEPPDAVWVEKPIFLYFNDVTEEDLARMSKASTKEEVKDLLKQVMKIDQPKGHRTEILVEMHYHNWAFCTSKGFPPEKTSTLLSLMKLVLEESVSKRLVPEDAFDLFKNWLLKHSVERPPRSVGILSFDNVKTIVEYMHNTFFRHYRLYMYAFMTRCDVTIQVDTQMTAIAPVVPQPFAMRHECEVDPSTQPELHRLFQPSEEEQAEMELKRIQERATQQDPKTALIKRRVEEGVKQLMETFEQRLKEQDERFHSVLHS